jgi:hypothetical protein
MSWVRFCIFAVVLAGCGGPENIEQVAPSASDTATATAPAAAASSSVTDEKIGLPVYPGATEVEQSRVALRTGTGDTYGVAYRTSDSPAKVAAFYEAEGVKLGTLMESLNIGEELRSVGVDRTDGSKSSVKAAADGKGTTIISIHRLFPAK